MTQCRHSLIGHSSRIRGVPNTYRSKLKSDIVRGGRSIPSSTGRARQRGNVRRRHRLLFSIVLLSALAMAGADAFADERLRARVDCVLPAKLNSVSALGKIASVQ